MGKLKQASPVKFYFAKYFFLGFGLLQWTVALVLFLRFESTSKNTSASFIFLCLGSVLMVIFFYLNSSMRRVAVGKNRIVVIEGRKNLRVEWPEVKSINLIPIFNLYKLRLKSRRNPIYFFPSKNIEPAYDLLATDTSKMGDIVSKRKKEFGI
ncbi:MAG TPA: hypothetical protein VFU05_04185 [Cyclobacteriaceae bacterium]|nr:hypothetical protein [Cyclobacteriaceae bacterium]